MKASESFTLPANVDAPAYSTSGAALRAIAVTTAKAALDRVIGASSAPGTVPCPNGEGGIRTLERGCPRYSLSRRVPSATRPPLPAAFDCMHRMAILAVAALVV